MSIKRLITLVPSCDAGIPFQTTTQQSGPVKVSMRMRYRGRERTTELPLTEEVISQLVSQAEFRQIRTCDLVGELILTVAKKDLFRQVLDPHCQGAARTRLR